MKFNKETAMLFAAAIIGGGGFIGMKYLLDWGYFPLQVIAGRFFISSLCMLVFFFKSFLDIKIEEIKAGIILGIFLVGLFVFMVFGLKYTQPSVNAFLTNIQAVIVPFICWIIFKERPEKRLFVCAFFTVLGIALISLDSGFSIGFGEILSVMASFSFAMQVILMSKYVIKYNPLKLVIVENITVFLFSSFAVIIFEGVPNGANAIPAVFITAAMGFLCTFLYFVFQSFGQKRINSSTASIILSTESVFTVIISALLYGERLSFNAVLGCIIIFASVIAVEIKSNK